MIDTSAKINLMICFFLNLLSCLILTISQILLNNLTPSIYSFDFLLRFSEATQKLDICIYSQIVGTNILNVSHICVENRIKVSLMADFRCVWRM